MLEALAADDRCPDRRRLPGAPAGAPAAARAVRGRLSPPCNLLRSPRSCTAAVAVRETGSGTFRPQPFRAHAQATCGRRPARHGWSATTSVARRSMRRELSSLTRRVRWRVTGASCSSQRSPTPSTTHELVGEDLYVKAVHADEGPTIKRFRSACHGPRDQDPQAHQPSHHLAYAKGQSFGLTSPEKKGPSFGQTSPEKNLK